MSINKPDDTALLQFLPSGQEYEPADVCKESFSLLPGTSLVAVGFPVNSGFSPLPIAYNNQSTRGWWRASGLTTYGISVGRVYNLDGRIVDLIQGGITDVNAVRFVVPMRKNISLLQQVDIRLGDCGENQLNASKSPSLTVVPIKISQPANVNYQRLQAKEIFSLITGSTLVYESGTREYHDEFGNTEIFAN